MIHHVAMHAGDAERVCCSKDMVKCCCGYIATQLWS